MPKLEKEIRKTLLRNNNYDQSGDPLNASRGIVNGIIFTMGIWAAAAAAGYFFFPRQAKQIFDYFNPYASNQSQQSSRPATPTPPSTTPAPRP